MATKVNVFKVDTSLREGVSTKGPNNRIERIQPGDYEAEYQCAGERVTEGGTNFWWVRIKVGSRVGWVSGVTVDEHGGNDRPIRDVNGDEIPQRKTVNV